MCKKTALGYDDIVLSPRFSNIRSRSEIDISVELPKGIKLEMPVIASPMDTICESDMAIAIGKAGGVGIIHRYMSIEEQTKHISRAKKETHNVGFACGVNGKDDLERAAKGIECGANIICIDIANGGSIHAVETAIKLQKLYPNVHIMAGNVANASQLGAIERFVDSVRVGIGGGSVCTTSRICGVGLPSVTSIELCYQHTLSSSEDVALIADGSIKYTGDIVKAFAVGADVVMLGSLLSGYTQSCGNVVRVDGKEYKQFRGMASREAREEFTGKKSYHIEGISTLVETKGDVTEFFEAIKANLKSGMSYLNARNMKEFIGKPTYFITTHSGFLERLPRYTEIK